MTTLILGNGYTGKRLAKLIPRSKCTELPALCQDRDLIPFDFNDTRSWNNLPHFDRAVITFKMTDEARAQEFSLLFKEKKTILLSSARNLQNSLADEIISERTPLKNCPRAKAESFFEEQALILYLGLIWGPERMPEKWISEKRIKNGSKYINFINVDDLCNIIAHLINGSCKGKLLISDGCPLKWQELADAKGLKLSSYSPGPESRRFNTERLRESLPENFNFTKP